MNSWLTRFRISAARDEGQPLPESLRKKINRSSELRKFEENTNALEHALRAARPEEVTPPFLGSSIMRAVKESGRPMGKAHVWTAALRVSGAFGTALVALTFAIWLTGTRPVRPDAPNVMASTSSAFQLGDTVTHTLPLATVTPLNDELSRLNLDLTNTARFLLANVP
ncbi:MAG TPA: hypothetical protein VKV04_09310 [Verrucomicrobiae bacterium]|nr:hypothetical protein [Verrucomicrobiae bacterium]